MSILSGRGNSSRIQVASLDLLYILLYTDISLRLFLDFLAGLSLIYCYDYYYDYYYYSVGSFFFFLVGKRLAQRSTFPRLSSTPNRLVLTTVDSF